MESVEGEPGEKFQAVHEVVAETEATGVRPTHQQIRTQLDEGRRNV